MNNVLMIVETTRVSEKVYSREFIFLPCQFLLSFKIDIGVHWTISTAVC